MAPAAGTARSLSRYARKRRFDHTPEPRPRAVRSGRRLSFCVQQHAASRLHHDFRLELDGVLKSWAVPKGPSLDPDDKRLAVQVEDHPVAYGDFEGVIAEGEYGGGTVLLWDRGTWEPEGDARAGLAKGKLAFQLHGEKLRGRWALVRMHGRPGDDGRQWLLIKERDDEARPGEDVVASRPESVKSGSDLLGVAAAHGATARQQARARAAPGVGIARTGGRTASRARRASPRARVAAPKAARGGRAALPDFVEPQLCTLVDAAPDGTEWLHEIKFDGYRMLCRLQRGRARLASRNGIDWTARLPALAAAIAALPARAALIDGELVSLDARGRSGFSALKDALGAGRQESLAFMAFDLLHLDGRDLRPEPLVDRKRELAALLRRAGRSVLHFSDHITGHGPAFLREACRKRLEGIVSKRAASPHRSGRGGDWFKVKCVQRQEFVIAGFTPPSRAGLHLGSLILGVHEGGSLRYAGRVGTGFGVRERAELRKRLVKLAAARPPFEQVPREPGLRGARWARPRLVAEVQFTEWTADGRLRHPSYQGLREDKPASDVVVERPRVAPRVASLRVAAGGGPQRRVRAAPKAEPATVAGVTITHPDRQLWPEDGITKADLARYYAEIADDILPQIAGRPLTLVRCPEGRAGGCFFQKHATGRQPASIRLLPIREAGKAAPYMVIDDAAGLAALVQMGALELHVWGSRADDVERPDRMVFDLDPDEGIPFADVMQAARDVRARLATLDLQAFVMTTGGKGLHVVVPLQRRLEHAAVHEFSGALARQMATEEPERFVAQASKAARRGRIFIDWLRNGRGATAVCPFSTRARPRAPVAVPLAWSELRAGLAADRFTMRDVPARLARQRRDPWAGYDKAAGRISAAAQRKVSRG